MLGPAVRNGKTLNSWKEIASYLGRGVRTVQRWESELRLPVHRLGSTDRSPVFAFRAQLDHWLLRQTGAEQQSPAASPNAKRPDRVGNSLTALERSARLRTKVLQLIETQRMHTRLITEQVERMRHLVPTIGTSNPGGMRQPYSVALVRRK